MEWLITIDWGVFEETFKSNSKSHLRIFRQQLVRGRLLCQPVKNGITDVVLFVVVEIKVSCLNAGWRGVGGGSGGVGVGSMLAS